MFRRTTWAGLLSLLVLVTLAFGAAAQEVPRGTWFDEVILVEEPSPEKAISRLLSGDIDLLAQSVSNAALFEQVRNHPDLDYYSAFGSYSELTFNVVGPEFNDGRLNPFSSARVREAMNWLVDRDYIAQELYGGLAVPKYTVLNPAFADYIRVVEKMRELETMYAYDLGRAEMVIAEEMEAMGATLVNGKWHYKGQPVVLNILIRTEDERLAVGDYVASQLEKIGFTVTRDYKTGSEASPIWYAGDPATGQWHVYTGGWLSPVVYRDQTHNFVQMNTSRIETSPLWQALNPPEELDDIANRLYIKDFSSMEERNQLLERILELAMKDSPRIYLVDVLGFVPRRAEVSVASDLAGQVAGTLLWPSTLRRGDEIGGTIRVAMPQLLVEPWNPIAGSNQVYDSMAYRATMDRSIIVDPYTGNYWAHRIEKAEVYVEEGLPVSKTLDWVDLHFVDEIVVPEDAWVDWDAAEQRLITAGEKWPEGVTARRRSVVYFPEDFFETVKWHDGSPISLGDIMFAFIIGLDRGKPESPIYDASAEADLQSALQAFRGMRILSTDPLIIESYSNSWSLDAEFMYGEYMPVDINLGPIAWHTIGLGVRAELNKELAFSAHKANELNVTRMGFHTGPSLEILARHLQEAKAENWIPYAKALSEFIDAEEIATRYENISRWYAEKGHLWIGTGPVYLDRVYPVEKMIVLRRNPDYPDTADKWTMFDRPRRPEIEVVSDVRLRVRQGSEFAFDVKITFEGEPYPSEHMQEVLYLVRDSSGRVVLRGDAKLVDEGHYRIELLPSQTRQLRTGSNTLDVVAVSKLVGGATFHSVTFVSTP